jgi:hypothetical protein
MSSIAALESILEDLKLDHRKKVHPGVLKWISQFDNVFEEPRQPKEDKLLATIVTKISGTYTSQIMESDLKDFGWKNIGEAIEGTKESLKDWGASKLIEEFGLDEKSQEIEEFFVTINT